MIGTILLTWHFRTRKLDFMTPRGVSLNSENSPESFRADPIPIQPEIEEDSESSEVLGNPEKTEEAIIPEITDLDLGDLESSPGLDSYQKFGTVNTPDRLFELSSALRARGQFERALLAFERIIDTVNADPAALKEAAQGIRTLAPTLPRWSIDPSSEINLVLHLGTAQNPSDQLKSALLEVATLIRESSSHQLAVTPKITTSNRGPAVLDSPLTLWIGTSEKKGTVTPVMTLRTSDDPGQAIADISFAVFQTVRNQLSELSYPPAPSLQESGQDLLSTYITRLMWRDFAQTLSKERNPEQDRQDSPN